MRHWLIQLPVRRVGEFIGVGCSEKRTIVPLHKPVTMTMKHLYNGLSTCEQGYGNRKRIRRGARHHG